MAGRSHERQPCACPCGRCNCTTADPSFGAKCWLCTRDLHPAGNRRELFAALGQWTDALEQTRTTWGNQKGPHRPDRAAAVFGQPAAVR